MKIDGSNDCNRESLNNSAAIANINLVAKFCKSAISLFSVVASIYNEAVPMFHKIIRCSNEFNTFGLDCKIIWSDSRIMHIGCEKLKAAVPS